MRVGEVPRIQEPLESGKHLAQIRGLLHFGASLAVMLISSAEHARPIPLSDSPPTIQSAIVT